MYQIMFKFFDKPAAQRVMYGILIILWIAMNYYNNSYQLGSEKHKTFGILYLWVFMFPALIFLIQVIFNSFAGWLTSLLVYLAFIIYVCYNVVSDLFLQKNLYSGVYHPEDYLLLAFTLTIIVGIGYLLIRIRKFKTLF